MQACKCKTHTNKVWCDTKSKRCAPQTRKCNAASRRFLGCGRRCTFTRHTPDNSERARVVDNSRHRNQNGSERQSCPGDWRRIGTWSRVLRRALQARMQGEELLHELTKQGASASTAIFNPCDVTDYLQFEEAFQSTISKLGGVDIVVNNASVMNDRLWELEVDVNLNGVIRGLLLAFRFLGRDRGGPGGIVVNISSSSCQNPLISLPVFTATKHAVASMTRCYGDASHVNLTGVKVVAMCPSPTPAALQGDARKRLLSGEYEQTWQRDVSRTTPLKSEHAAKALVEIIRKAPSGSCWLVENSKAPSEIKMFS